MADKITSVVAREEDGNIQITFTLPIDLVQKAQEETITEMAKDMEIPGFRKGMAPISKVAEKVSKTALIEHSLSHLLPQALAESINENKLQIAIYPKFELISAEDGKDWQVKGITCELPEVELGDYKKAVTGLSKSRNILVPGKEAPKELAKEEKEQMVVKAILDTVKITIPKILVEEEVASRLSNLLARLEKLGLALEGYLGSIGKTVDGLRSEYEAQAKDAITLDLALSKIAETDGIKVDPKEVEAALGMSVASQSKAVENQEDIESRKRMLESILKRRQALDSLILLA